MKNLSVLYLAILFSTLLNLACSNSANTSSKDEDNNKMSDSTQNDTDITQEESFKKEVIIRPDQIKNGNTFNNLTVENYIFEKDRSFGFTLKGEFKVCGEVMIDDMWGELAIQITEDSNPHKNIMIEYDGYKTKLMQFCYISNADDFKKQLSSEEIEKLKNKEKIKLCLTVKDFSMGGKMDGYTESRIDFVKIN
ncbi:MAG: hypothetical protein PHE56_04855 [Bacteroidales bacterium]|nr:hypothetical protein [Bacteroidales bacterium]